MNESYGKILLLKLRTNPWFQSGSKKKIQLIRSGSLLALLCCWASYRLFSARVLFVCVCANVSVEVPPHTSLSFTQVAKLRSLYTFTAYIIGEIAEIGLYLLTSTIKPTIVRKPRKARSNNTNKPQNECLKQTQIKWFRSTHRVLFSRDGNRTKEIPSFIP